VVRLAQENRSWGYNRIVGALKRLGCTISDQTVGNILKRHGIPSAPERQKTTTWKEFIRTHMDVLVATDFFTTEVWTTCGLVMSCSFRGHAEAERVTVCSKSHHATLGHPRRAGAPRRAAQRAAVSQSRMAPFSAASGSAGY
jgi:hypothetical protein